MQSVWTKTLRNALIAAAGLAVGCGNAPGDELLGDQQQALSPGNDAQFVSSTIPTAMAPGERLDVQVVMKNTGTALDGSNTWTPAGYSLYRTNSTWSWVSTPVPANTPVGSNATFNFVIVAPTTPGTYAFGARMRQDLLFGSTASVPNIVVANTTTPRWGCTYLPGSSTIPTTLAPGANASVTIVVQNTGTSTWNTSGTYLGSQDSPTSLWGQTVAPLPTTVAPGGTATFTFSIKAPSTAGTYSLKRQMTNGQVGFFSATPCVSASIAVGGSAALNSSLVSQDFPTVMAPGESRFVNVTLQNTGTQTWTNDGNFALFTRNSPSSLWGTTQANVKTTTAPNTNTTLSFTITAPSTPGSYNHRWQLRKFSGTDAGFFGVSIDIPMTVDANAQAQYNASVVSQTIPTRITAGKKAMFSVRMQNTGSAAWTGSSFALYSVNTPTSLWGVTSSPLGAAETVAASGERDFTFQVTAPTTAGTYSSSWQMRQAGGVDFFGAIATTAGIEVTLCGNGMVDAGETCDDSNLVSGDGCSETCQTETTVTVNLATDTANRTLTGLQSSKALSNVGIGDFTGDGRADVVTGQNVNLFVSGKSRNQAGELLGYDGTTFYGGAAESLTVYGAEAGDLLGAQGAGLLVADVTGDGVGDIVATAAGADGPANGRLGCGEVYVLQGGGTLSGIVDLGATTPPAALKATIVGAAASDALRLLALGDVTNDGVADLVLGAPNNVYVVPGGVGLTGSIDLVAPPAGVVVISGTGLGDAAAVGDLGGSTAPDLLLGAQNFTHGGNSESGAAWAIFGPINSAHDMSQAVGSASGPSVAWFGAGTNDHFGANVAVADVLSTTAKDVIIGATQQRKAGLQVGAVDVWAGAVTSGSTFDLSAAATPTLTILGADQYDNAGSALAAADWNGDGVMDLAVAAVGGDGPTNAGDGEGELVIVRGSRSLSGTIDLSSYSPLFKVYGAADRDLLGSRQNHVAFGDIDGNGSPDLCVGSPKGGTNATLIAPGRIDCFQ